jgi:2-polyprenyl-6-methoxyphenol hydroxylase-like FAD-dependent oxidoreductase
MPDGVAALERLGVTLAPQHTHPFSGIRFLASGLSVDASFPDGASGFGVRRTTLHDVLTERAARLGIHLLWRTAVTSISNDAVYLGRTKIRTRWIVGADGGNSRVRRWAGLGSHRRRNSRYAFRQHYRVAPWTDRMEIHWGPSAQMYVASVTGEDMCVAVASHDQRFRLEEALRSFPELRDRLAAAPVTSAEKGAITTTCTLKRVCRGNVALIGDASGTVDAITGEGLCLSFSQSLVLADCLRSGDLGRYQQEHRRLALRPQLMAHLMLTLDRRPRLQRRILQVLRRRPEIFRRLLALHVGAVSPMSLAIDGLTLAWGLLTA